MPFHTKPFVEHFGSFRVYLPETVEREKKVKGGGTVTEFCIEQVSQSKPMPDMVLYDLKTMLDSGVPIQQVQTKILGSDDFNVDSTNFGADVGTGAEEKEDDSNNNNNNNN